MDENVDTILTVPGEDAMAELMVSLRLEVEEPDLSNLDGLLDDAALTALGRAVSRTDQPYLWAAKHVEHAIGHLHAAEFLYASPPLVIGVEGLYWAVAEEKGYIDQRRHFTSKAGRTGTARNAADIIRGLPINERVQRFLTRHAFGGAANSFRHGTRPEVEEREQCLIWLLALTAWVDGWGWEWAYPRGVGPQLR